MVVKDETNTTSKDSEKTSKEQDGSTSVPETFTKESEDKAVSDALSSAGRTAKDFDSRKSLLDAREQAVKDSEAQEIERQRTRDAKELEAAEGDPEKLSAIKLRRDARAKFAEAERKEKDADAKIAENKVAIDAANAIKLETDIFTIAEKHKVDPGWLKGLGVSNLKTLEEIAKGASEKKPFNPDPGKTTGGDSFSSLSPKGKVSEALRRMK